MGRRVALPQADDLFRPTAVPDPPADEGGDDEPARQPRGRAHPRVVTESELSAEVGKPQPEPDAKVPSGRVKHDEKMTVYITSDELLDLEHARLVLRRTLGSAVDRGRIVRAAVALALADLEANGDQSALVQRLTQA